MALEYQRYGRDKSTLVNSTYINSGEYRNKFNKLAENKDVARVLYSEAKKMLTHRSGTKVEDMCWVDSKTGEIVAQVNDLPESITERVIYSESVKKCICGRKHLIAMHTHPSSLPPSARDFNSALHNGYEMALVICHDGKIFQYVSGEEIREELDALYIGEFLNKGFSEYDAQIKALKEIKANYEIDFWEVLP